ncbi:TadE/TadG family type IV pilus assembly protein [Neobacillus niacini]|uniref:TadE/TadG family type IV pilus assembly protein n=1 Tax=Neobacillus niacini TaxID=86668 RepID=UPI0021CB6914|nr:pilus assembly protein [Neobacillus niacini]MCM3768619.1 pilus assembly protein [Neobacillus niacini]
MWDKMRAAFLKNEKGSFIIEASLVFPIIFITIIMFLYLSIYIYEHAQLYTYANKAANRIAYAWTNSKTDPVTFELKAPGESDGLYWRLTDDRMLGSLIGLSGGDSGSISVGGSGSGLVGEKLAKFTGVTIPDYVKGTVSYKNVLVEKAVVVELNRSLSFPKVVEDLLGHDVKVKASATVTDPVEFIRTIELIKLYGQELQDSGVSAILLKQKGAEKK